MLNNSYTISQVFWDVRSDSDALYAHYGIKLSNTYDLQILDLALRRTRKEGVKFVNSLSKVLQQYNLASSSWTRTKDIGISLFDPKKGGSYQIFEKRPLDQRLVTYCANDVALMLKLEDVMRGGSWKYDQYVSSESDARVAASQTKYYTRGGSLAPAVPRFF